MLLCFPIVGLMERKMNPEPRHVAGLRRWRWPVVTTPATAAGLRGWGRRARHSGLGRGCLRRQQSTDGHPRREGAKRRGLAG